MAASSDQELKFEKQKSSSDTADNYPQITTSSTSQVEPGQSDGFSARSVLKVTLLGSEWNSSEGGLSTLNRELAIYLSKHPKVEVTLLVPEGVCKDDEKKEAGSYGITIVEAKEQTGYDPLDWLTSPPRDLSVDVIIGHGTKLGRQVQGIRYCAEFKNCKWVQVVHIAPEDLGKFKDYTNPTSKGERKHQVEVDLCKRADLVMPVGPRLTEFYSSYLQRYKKEMDVLSFTPGLFEREFGDLEQDANNNADFKVLIFGRGDKEDFELKGYSIAAKAFTDPRLEKKPYQLIFVGAPKEKEKQEEFKERLLQCGIAKEQLIVRTFIENRDSLKDLLCEVDLAIMPSKSEGFGLVALEALSAGLPILVGSRSGFAKALENIPHGYSCIMYSDDPAEWAKSIEAVRVRHGMRLREIKTLKASYGEMYSWRKQCDALVERTWKMIHGMIQLDTGLCLDIFSTCNKGKII
ncbi:D-inositol 3-phosphate glycosyltransferase-like [Porites lutea]|uniref:D-inositol 3-phosphate glycosyltransferase-like n=1 Tax=Porites lutea TaxID=51062 RepID=UPI003CC5391C